VDRRTDRQDGADVNNEGHSATLLAAHPENLNAVKSGVYSRTGRVLAERAQKIAESLMTLPHVHPLDSIACVFIFDNDEGFSSGCVSVSS
jgi:hypothetical protein